jgi:twitching motility protein PilI
MAKRTNLREFQQNLSDRMLDKSRSGGQLPLLGVQIAGQNWLVEMRDISEVLSPPSMAKVPLTRAWFRGVANVRGNLYCIADLAAYMNQGEASGAFTNRILLVSDRYGVNAALLVDCVLGLRDVSRWKNDVVRAHQYTDEQGGVWHKLGVVDLLEQPDFLQIGI